MQPVSLPQLRPVRWAVRAALTLGVAASVAANILHANPNPISQAIAAWPPLALLITVELISRVPMDRRALAAARLIATTAIAGIAAYVSYFHMAGVAARYGERGPSPYLLPLSVDGLIIVASVSLVELAGRIRNSEAAVAAAEVSASPTVPQSLEEHGAAPITARLDLVAAPPTNRVDGASLVVSDMEASQPDNLDGPQAGTELPAPVEPTPAPPVHQYEPLPAVDSSRTATATRGAAMSETAAAVAYWRDREPELRPAEIAERIGKSERQVRRVLATLETSDPQPKANGAPVPALADARK